LLAVRYLSWRFECLYQRPIYQLPLELDLPVSDETMVSPEEARIRSEAAQKALELMFGKSGAPRWLEEYFELARGGWPWRVAAYIAWASSPRAGREPKTQDELARFHLGLTSDRAITTWRRKNPAIDETVRMLQSGPLFKHRAEIFTALVAVAVKPEYKSHNDRKLAFELMGDHIPTSKLQAELKRRGIGVDDLSELSDDELMALARVVEEKAEKVKMENEDDHPA
jgi:hypothetical protein